MTEQLSLKLRPRISSRSRSRRPWLRWRRSTATSSMRSGIADWMAVMGGLGRRAKALSNRARRSGERREIVDEVADLPGVHAPAGMSESRRRGNRPDEPT